MPSPKLLTLLLAAVLALTARGADRPRPLMRDFIGINGHTVQFKPELYAPIARLVRDYHPLQWDLGDDTSFVPEFPFARNRVDWSKVYGSWVKAGQRVNASIIFDELAASAWKDPARDARAYGEAFAKFFGPSSSALVEAAEIGNEPGLYSDEEYRRIFEAMATGFRAGDPKLKIATCAVFVGPSKRYFKSVDTVARLESLYDVVNFHLYAEVEGWPTWRRSYPEDPKIAFRKDLRTMVAWRDQHVPDKELWLTEFGWDASTKPAPATGDFAKWEGSTEVQQAQWIVRAWLLTVRERIDRAYLFFFNDDDQPSVHGSAGVTRNFQPKPSYYAAAWLQRSLGDYRFTRVIREEAEDCYAYEFTHGTEPQKRVLAVWKPKMTNAERMPLSAEPPERVEAAAEGGKLTVRAEESPLFIWLE
jgi:hypothetical protein